MLDTKEPNGRPVSPQPLFTMETSARSKAVCGQQLQSGQSFPVYDRRGKGREAEVSTLLLVFHASIN